MPTAKTKAAKAKTATAKTFNFADALLHWFDQHGRKNLPWQHPITPYRVWLSEVMLQQTQVETVIPYFTRFLEHFPNVEDLAKAPQDEVLHLWTGLGYYARARNLHKCAQQISEEFGGEFPGDVETLTTLPGIGRSTACAISSIAFGQSTAILDGNVKRVLTRFHAVDGWPGLPKVEKALWVHANANMPEDLSRQRCADYTQAIMDLGATLCTRSKPACLICPMQTACKAHLTHTVDQFPGKKPKKTIPEKSTVMLLAENKQGEIFLYQRPQTGIWGGLWSLPEFDSQDDAITYCVAKLGKVGEIETWPTLTHVFSHYKLHITPVHIAVKTKRAIQEPDQQLWYSAGGSHKLGLAAPVKKLLQAIDN
ncbi:Adenine DNA glycosylase [Thalassocella blandensis]|nr:Adenine DNA glycosylase [Thalassocella blandensis]